MIRFQITRLEAELESLTDLSVIQQISGRECYYKRTIDETHVRVYFRLPTDPTNKLIFDFESVPASYFKYYHVYTFDTSTDPIEVDEKKTADYLNSLLGPMLSTEVPTVNPLDSEI